MKYVYLITNYGKVFDYELSEWLIEARFVQYKFQISIYYNYALDGTKIVVLSYLMIVYIVILIKILENGLWVL